MKAYQTTPYSRTPAPTPTPTHTHTDRTPAGVSKMSAFVRRLLSLNVQGLRVIGSSVMSLVWVACGRADVFATGVSDEGAKPWDYAAGYVIATEAGAVFRRVDNRSYPGVAVDDTSGVAIESSRAVTGDDIAAFDVYSKSCICAATAELADTLGDVMRGAQRDADASHTSSQA